MTKRGTLSLTLVGTGVATMITCSIEGHVLNMGYVIVGESVSSSFKVNLKHIAGALVPTPAFCKGVPLWEGSGLPWSGSQWELQQLPPPLPSPARGRLRRPLPPPLGCWGLLRALHPSASGPLHSCPICDEAFSAGPAW